MTAWIFTLDGSIRVTAIRVEGASLEQIERYLLNQFGPGRVTDVRAQS